MREPTKPVLCDVEGCTYRGWHTASQHEQAVASARVGLYYLGVPGFNRDGTFTAPPAVSPPAASDPSPRQLAEEIGEGLHKIGPEIVLPAASEGAEAAALEAHIAGVAEENKAAGHIDRARQVSEADFRAGYAAGLRAGRGGGK